MRSPAALALFAASALLGLGIYAGLAAPQALAQADYSMVNTRDTVHINSCGSCHLPYSPGLLPIESWSHIMESLDEHFGVTVAVSPENSVHILSYLEKYALREGQDSIMGQLAEGLPHSPPIRITELPAFVEMHFDAAQRLGFESSNEAPLGSCENCHRAAASHIFDKALLQIGHGDGRLSDYK
jgi:hypothetical protein